MNILFTGVGGPTPRSFAKSLKYHSEHFKDVKLIGTDINPLAIGLYQKELFDFSYVIPRPTESNYWDVIEEIIEKHQVDVAVIMPELEVVEWSKRIESKALNCKVFLPNSEINGLLVDKSKTFEILENTGLVPQSVKFTRDEKNLESIFDNLGNGFWVRSSSGTSGLGSLRIDGLNSLKNWIEINPNVHEFLASKFLSGRNLACKLLYWKGNLVRTACGERVNYIMAKVSPSGITGNTSFGRLLNEENLVERAVAAMDCIFEYTSAEKHGFYTVDFKENENGIAFITEINVRHVAFTQCFAMAGANFPEDTVRLLSNDMSFDKSYKMYEFNPGTIFLRDVDETPVMMLENDLLSK
jgi:carbamoyl-phosphate synthase large subunit